MFGGGANGSAYKDSYALTLPLDRSVAAWHTLSPTTAITARDQVTVALDGGVMTAFGGFGSGTFPGEVGVPEPTSPTRGSASSAAVPDGASPHQPTRRRWRSPARARRTPTMPAGPAPPARWSAGYGYDPVRRRLVVFGGQTGPDGAGSPLQDTWALALDGDARWTQLAELGPQPAPRRSPAAAVRVAAGGAQLVMATGLTGSTADGPAEHHNDLWSLDLGDDSAQWVELAADSPSAGPAPRRSASAVWDPAADRLIVVFGRDAARFFDETWSFDLSARTWYQDPG